LFAGWAHLKLLQRFKGLPTLVKVLLNSNEPFKGWQPWRQKIAQLLKIYFGKTNIITVSTGDYDLAGSSLFTKAWHKLVAFLRAF
jgi:hypothetical protein